MKLPWLAPVAAGCLLFAGCEIPTEPPILEQRWIIPIEETTLSVEQLLPAGVAVSGSNFSVSIDPFVTNQTLASSCAGCVALNGLTVPAPPFTTSFSASEDLPAGVTAAMISSASIEIQIANGFSFDPIAGGGTLTVTISDGQGGAELGQVVIDGATEAMTAGGTLTRTISIASKSIGTTFFASVDVVSKGGQVSLIDTSDQITVTATTTSLLVSSATVNVTGQSVEFDAEPLDVEDIDSQLIDRIQEASLVLDIVNPFGISVSATIVIGPTSKTLSIDASAASSTSITYTNDELRMWLGQPDITFSGSGTASGGSITVTPGQEMTIQVTLDATIRIG
ncbi:MAG: hypothetical protein IIB36_10775 [Gemmatimonadetes bacterium]|nr:hypothetical protein [Gemmatimonadota bacterium]